jgi:hypothetical protein
MDYFDDDDDFDDLPEHALQDLENKAIQATQAQRLLLSQPHSTQTLDEYGLEDEDLDDAEVTNDVLVPVGRPLVDKSLPNPSRPPPPPSQQRWHPQPGPTTTAALSSRSRYPSVGPQSLVSQRIQPPSIRPRIQAQSSQFVRPPPHPNPHYVAPQSQARPPQPLDASDTAALRNKIKALEQDLWTAKGEISVVRSKAQREEKEHNAEIMRLEKQNAEQLANQQKLVEQAVAAERSAATELDFLRSDLREVSTRARRKDAQAPPAAAGMTTPKKAAKTWGGIADGFDDVDVVISPSKGKRTAAPVPVLAVDKTPTKLKRKRPALDSPVQAQALEVHTGDVEMSDGTSSFTLTSVPVSDVGRKLPFEVSHGVERLV